MKPYLQALLIGVLFTAIIVVGIADYPLSPVTDQKNECTQASKPACLAVHVHHPNTMNLYLPNFLPDPFTCSACSTASPSVLPGLQANNLKQYNATNGFWIQILLTITYKISPAGTAYVYIFIDGAIQGGIELETSSTLYVTQSIFLSQNNTFTDNLTHTVDIRVASSNIVDTVSVRAFGTDGTGYETLMSITDLSSAGPS